ncbi:MAG: hypothetical protein QM756_24410 [Polyangiaceae bacterium]
MTQLSDDVDAYGMSGDGSCIVGDRMDHEGVVWRQTGISTFGKSIVGQTAGPQRAHDASGDCKVVVGWALAPAATLGVVAEGSSEFALYPIGAVAATTALAVSSDGLVVVGWGTNNGDGTRQAYRWTRTAPGKYTAERLDDLAGGTVDGAAVDTNQDGSVVVGFGTTATATEPFIWDKTKGVRRLVDELASRGYEWPSTLQLDTVAAINPSGEYVVGTYTNPEGKPEAWRIRLK